MAIRDVRYYQLLIKDVNYYCHFFVYAYYILHHLVTLPLQ